MKMLQPAATGLAALLGITAMAHPADARTFVSISVPFVVGVPGYYYPAPAYYPPPPVYYAPRPVVVAVPPYPGAIWIPAVRVWGPFGWYWQLGYWRRR
jgi:hypothetical protein